MVASGPAPLTMLLLTTACKALRLATPEPSSAVAARAVLMAVMSALAALMPSACNWAKVTLPPDAAATTAAAASARACSSATVSTSAGLRPLIRLPNKEAAEALAAVLAPEKVMPKAAQSLAVGALAEPPSAAASTAV